MKLTIFALQLLAVSAFTSPSVVTRHASPLFMSTTVENVTPITVTGNNIDLTPALVEYINKKLERPLGKLRANGSIKDCSVHLIVNKNPKVRDIHRLRSLKVDQPTHIRRTQRRVRIVKKSHKSQDTNVSRRFYRTIGVKLLFLLLVYRFSVTGTGFLYT